MASQAYANHIKSENFDDALYWKRRLLKTYKVIVEEILERKFAGTLLDLGCGNNAFVVAVKEIGLAGTGIDFDAVDLEKDIFPFTGETFNIVTANALIEHIQSPSHFFREVHRVLVEDGLFLLTTPNWELCHKTFYDDPTHVRPYTRKGLTTQLRAHGFEVLFLEPHYICRHKLFWKLPLRFKIPLWTRSMICAAVRL